MAQRFGGRYSPDGQAGAPEPLDDRVVDAAGARANLLFLPPLLLVFVSLGSGPVKLVEALVAGAILALAAWLLRDGLRAAAAYNARKVARKPAIPRKMFASVLTGAGVALAAWTGDNGMLGSVLYGIAALGLHVAAFGIDPLRDKLAEGVDQFQQDRVARVADEADGYLRAMQGHIASIGDRKLDLRIATFQASARKMIRTVEDDPRDLTEARRYLVVYLLGARDAAAKFSDLYKRSPDPADRASFEALLADLDTGFTQTTAKMLQGGRSDMDIEIKVLRDRLQRDGVKPD